MEMWMYEEYSLELKIEVCTSYEVKAFGFWNHILHLQ